MLVLTGMSGSGKSTLERELFERGVEKTKSHTTRARRSSDNDDSYYFVSLEELDRLSEVGEIAERVSYAGNSYALSVAECVGNKVVVAIPEGLRQLQEKGLDIVSVYLEVSEQERVKRMRERGDTEDMISTRLVVDAEEFAGVTSKVDYVYNNNGSISEAIDYLLDIIKNNKGDSVLN